MVLRAKPKNKSTDKGRTASEKCDRCPDCEDGIQYEEQPCPTCDQPIARTCSTCGGSGKRPT